MRSGRHQLLCIIITVFLVLSGTVCGDIETHPSFCRASDSAEEAESFIKSAHTVITDREVCTEEVSGLRGNVFARHLSSRFDGRGRKTKTSTAFTVVCSTSLQRHINSFICTESDGYGNKYAETRITDYIHKSDGKKRIESYH